MNNSEGVKKPAIATIEGDPANLDSPTDAFPVNWHETFGMELLRFCCSRVGTDAGSDVFQDVCVKVLRFKNQFTGGNFRAWLFQIARRTILDYVKKKRPHYETELVAAAEDNQQPSQLTIIVGREKAQRLEDCIKKLPEEQRQVFHMRSIGLSYDEIAKRLTIQPGTVGSRSSRMIANLRECVEAEA